MIDEIRNARLAGGDYHLVTAYHESVKQLERMHLLEFLKKQNLHPTKAEAIAAVARQLDDGVCATCRIRAFVECGKKPAPEGVDPAKDPAEIEVPYKYLS